MSTTKWMVAKFRTKGEFPFDYWTVGRDTGRPGFLRYELPDGKTTKHAEDCELHRIEREAVERADRLNRGPVAGGVQ